MAAFILKVGNQRFPTDEEFKAELPLVPLYNLRVREYALRKLENFYHGKEPIDVESFTIEHIMPQNKNLSQKWRNELGALWEEIHQKYLHTIGNLTITGYSSELGDLPFLEKRNRFFSSPLSLNHRLANLDHWDVEEIKKRASDLTNVAIQIWPFPNLASSTLEKYKGGNGRIK